MDLKNNSIGHCFSQQIVFLVYSSSVSFSFSFSFCSRFVFDCNNVILWLGRALKNKRCGGNDWPFLYCRRIMRLFVSHLIHLV